MPTPAKSFFLPLSGEFSIHFPMPKARSVKAKRPSESMPAANGSCAHRMIVYETAISSRLRIQEVRR